MLFPADIDVLKFIEKYITENMCSPSYDEILSLTHCSSKSHVYQRVHKLLDGGMITKTRAARSIQLTEKAKSMFVDMRKAQAKTA